MKLLSSTPAPPAQTYAVPRRSQRIWLTAGIRIHCAVRDQQPAWMEETSSTFVNAHGALILIEHKLATGQSLVIENIKTAQRMPARVITIGAVISGMQEVGIEFVDPSADFWGVANPPADWAPFTRQLKK